MREEKVFTAVLDTPLGKMRAAARGNAVSGLWFMGQKYFPDFASSCRKETWQNDPDYPVFAVLKTWLGDYFAGKNPEISFPLLPVGTEFRQSVWKLLKKIPYGKTCTYGDITAELKSKGKKACAQAVGGSVGHNPISILIPCHRVLGADGSLTGYAGGVEKKRALLELEKSVPGAVKKC